MSDIQKYKRIQTTEALEKILQIEPSEAQFDACLDQLGDFISAQLAGKDYETLFPDLVAYLNTDASLADIYSRLYTLAVDVQSDQIRITEPDRPTRDLIFDAIEYLEGAIAMLFSADILGRLHLEPALGGGALKASEAKAELYKLDPKEHSISEWPATITVQSTVQSNRDEAGLCTVQVQVTPPGRAFPNLSGIEVSVEIPDLETYEQKTDMLGVATFDNLQVAHLSQMRVIIKT